MGTDWQSGVLPHGDLVQLAPNLWQVTGSLASMPLPRNMVVWRGPDGGLVLHSVIALTDAGMAKLESLGKPKIMIVPNGGHREDAPRYKARYPDLKVVGPARSKAKIEEVIQLDALAEDALPALGWTIHDPMGMKPDGFELDYQVPLDGGGTALIVCDAIAEATPAIGWKGKMLSVLGVPGGGVGLPRIVRFFFLKDRAKYKAFVRTLAELPDVKVVCLAHGGPIAANVASVLRDVAEKA